MQHVAYIGMGSNIDGPAGPPDVTLAAAVQQLARLGQLTRRSSLFLSTPVGYADQPDFLNAVVRLETALTPQELLRQLMAIEQKFGRDRQGAVANGPRPLDLDLLLFDDWMLSAPDLVVPHPRMAERAFVLIPMVEVAPTLMVPGAGLSVLELAGQLTLESRSGLRRVVRESWNRLV